MGILQRSDFSHGWMPSADAFNAPKNALLRMDNCVLDELGVVSLRQGSVKLNSSAFADTDVHSLFTITLNGARCRFCGASNKVYLNGVSTGTAFAGSGDIAFGAHMGQTIYARSTTKKKHDGTTERNWGIAAPNAAPTLTALASDSKTFATCDSSETPILTVNEGSLAFVADRSGTASAAAELTPDSITGRGTMTKMFAAPTDFTVYDAGQIGTDDDLIDLYVYVTEPQYPDAISLMIDVNDGTFQQDYFLGSLVNGTTVDVGLDQEQLLASDYTAEGSVRDDVLSRTETRGQVVTAFRTDKPVVNAGWTHFQIPRGQMERFGSTTGKDWSTVQAIRITVLGVTGGSGAAIRFDDIKILGGAQRPLTGSYKAIVVAVRNDGTYQALSPVSATSAVIAVKAQGIRATVASGVISALDPQVTELWLYLMGGNVNAFYRYAVLAGGAFSGAQTIDAITSDQAALIANIRLQTDNILPPDDIIAIDGPHYDRTLCLTAKFLYPSQELDPDGFSEGQVIKVGDASETALWIKRVNEQLYVGTTRDIYRFDGDWTQLADGTLNVTKRPLGVTTPPISSAVAVGTVGGSDLLVYLAADGWRALGGGLLISEAIGLLWRGYTRHGVSSVNISNSAARFRVAITKGILFAVTPEGTDTISSAAIHAYSFGKQSWYRYVYPQAFRSIYREPDGTVIAGDQSGFVRQLDLAAKTDDGNLIQVTLWTPVDDNGDPFGYKDAQNLQIRLDTGLAPAAIAFHLNGNDIADSNVTTTQDTTDVLVKNVSNVSEFTQIQLRITGSFSAFILRQFILRYLDNPAPLVLYDTGHIDLAGGGELSWLRRLHVKARSISDLTVTPYYDGVAGTPRTITVNPGLVIIYPVPFGREDKGTTARFVVTGNSPFLIWWIEAEFGVSGNESQKKKVRLTAS